MRQQGLSNLPNPVPASARFVLTGPSGWIGQAMLAHLAKRLETPLAGRVTLFGSSARMMETPSGEHLPVRALDEIAAEDVKGAHVIHLAYLTKDKVDLLGERAFTNTNLAIDDALLATLHQANPASLFIASSGAAALAQSGADLHPYGLAKLRQEARFLEWGAKAGVPVLAGRIFNIAGPYMNKLPAYALSNFALQAIEQGKIAITATTRVTRSFLHVDDLCALVVNAGLTGLGQPHPVDLCGGEVVEMADIAKAVAAGLGANIRITRPPVDQAILNAYLGNFNHTRPIARELNINLRPLSEQVRDTLAWILTLQPPGQSESMGSMCQAVSKCPQ